MTIICNLNKRNVIHVTNDYLVIPSNSWLLPVLLFKSNTYVNGTCILFPESDYPALCCDCACCAAVVLSNKLCVLGPSNKASSPMKVSSCSSCNRCWWCSLAIEFEIFRIRRSHECDLNWWNSDCEIMGTQGYSSFSSYIRDTWEGMHHIILL